MIVVGLGRIGSTFLRADPSAVGVRRGAAIPDVPGPIVVCTRNDDLATLLPTLPRPQDHVLIQNGALPMDTPTRGLLYFAVREVGGKVEAGVDSIFTGRHAPALIAALATISVPAVAVDRVQFQMEWAVKLAWIAVFGLLGDTFDESVGRSLARGDVRRLCDELAGVLDVPSPTLFHRLVAYSSTIPSYRASIKEPVYRNGWLLAEARRRLHATPLHESLCHARGVY